MAQMTEEEKRAEILYDEFQKVINKVNILNREFNAEMNHGVGFETEENRKEFIEYFDEHFNNATNEYNKFKIKLTE